MFFQLKDTDNNNFSIQETLIDNQDTLDLPRSNSQIASSLNLKEDESHLNSIQPIFIILSNENTIYGNLINGYLHGKYPHVSVSFDSSLKKLYSYKENGFFISSIKDIEKNKGIIKVIAVFVTIDQLNKIFERVKWYIKNKSETSYAFRLLPNIILNKNLFDTTSTENVCSTFVNSLFYDSIKAKLITNKGYKLVSPNTIDNSKNKKLFPIYEGSSLNYNPIYIDSIIKTLIANNLYKLLK